MEMELSCSTHAALPSNSLQASSADFCLGDEAFHPATVEWREGEVGKYFKDHFCNETHMIKLSPVQSCAKLQEYPPATTTCLCYIQWLEERLQLIRKKHREKALNSLSSCTSGYSKVQHSPTLCSSCWKQLHYFHPKRWAGSCQPLAPMQS